MERYEDIVEKLNEYISVKDNGLVEKKLSVGEMTFIQLRDRLLGNGKIIEEDFDKQIYVISVLAGAANMNTAVIGVKLVNQELHFAAYAKEGLIKQHTAEKAIEKLLKVLK